MQRRQSVCDGRLLRRERGIVPPRHGVPGRRRLRSGVQLRPDPRAVLAGRRPHLRRAESGGRVRRTRGLSPRIRGHRVFLRRGLHLPRWRARLCLQELRVLPLRGRVIGLSFLRRAAAAVARRPLSFSVCRDGVGHVARPAAASFSAKIGPRAAGTWFAAEACRTCPRVRVPPRVAPYARARHPCALARQRQRDGRGSRVLRADKVTSGEPAERGWPQRTAPQPRDQTLCSARRTARSRQ